MQISEYLGVTRGYFNEVIPSYSDFPVTQISQNRARARREKCANDPATQKQTSDLSMFSEAAHAPVRPESRFVGPHGGDVAALEISEYFGISE